MRAALIAVALLAALAIVALSAVALYDGASDEAGVERDAFSPPTHREGEQVAMPLTFPDGTTAELVYAPELGIAEMGVFPYTSGWLHSKSSTAGRGDLVGRDFSIRYGNVEDSLAARNQGRPPRLLAEYEGVDGEAVGLWDIRSNDAVHYLGFQFGHWAVLVYDYIGAGAMTGAERVLWSAHFSGNETPEGLLVLEGSGPLRLSHVGEHAGPALMFSAGERTRSLELFPGECKPHRDQTRLVEGKHVQWSGGFGDWCLSDSMRVQASGDNHFIGSLVRGLRVRNVAPATR